MRAGANVNLSGNQSLAVTSNLTVGNITLAGNASLFVANSTSPVTLTVLGEISLDGTSVLFVNGSTLAIDESYDVEWSLVVSGSAQFVLDNATVTTNGYQWGAEFTEDANVSVYSSRVAYPAGWVDTDLIANARLTLLDSWYASDVILYDSATAPSTANFTAGDSVGFNVWLTFKNGTDATVTLPGMLGWRNWTFPGNASASGVGYHIDLVTSYVQLFAAMLWQGAYLEVENSPDFAFALDQSSGYTDLYNLDETDYGALGYTGNGFSFYLVNSTVFTWNIYPFGGSVEVDHSEIGEVQSFGTANVTLGNDTLDGHGGYYGDQSTGSFTVWDSSIAAQVVAYAGRLTLEHCQVATVGVSRVLATGNGTVVSDDTPIAANDTYQAIGDGEVDVVWDVATNFSADVQTGTGLPTRTGPPAVETTGGAKAWYEWQSNGTKAVLGTADGLGRWSTPLLAEQVNRTGDHPQLYEGGVTWPDYATYWSVAAPTAQAWLNVSLQPLLVATNLRDLSGPVPVSSASFYLSFLYVMDPNVTTAAIQTTPAIALVFTWALLDMNLTLSVTTALAAGTTYSIVLGASAATVSGIDFGAPEKFTFQTQAGPAPAPTVASTTPSNGSTGVSVSTDVTVSFSESMASSTTAAFAISPSVTGSGQVSGALLTWQASEPLQYNTSYTVEITSTAATSVEGLSLAHSYEFTFRTEAAPATRSTPSQAATAFPWVSVFVLVVVAIAAMVLAAVWLSRRGRRPPSARPPSDPGLGPSPPV